MVSDEAPRARAGGRAARRALRTAPCFDMLPALDGTLPLCEVMDDSRVERIDAASMHILEDVGVLFRDPVALSDWKRAGAKVVGEMVHLDRGLVRELIATIPSEFTYHARDSGKNVRLGGRSSISTTSGGARRSKTSRCSISSATCFRQCIQRRITSSSRWTIRSATGISASPIRR